MAGIPYIRLSPQLDQDVKMDETDDEILGMAFILETELLIRKTFFYLPCDRAVDPNPHGYRYAFISHLDPGGKLLKRTTEKNNGQNARKCK